MPFVKLDCGILDSTLWINREQREIFITALLMAEPRELKDPVAQLEVCSIKETGFMVPPGWYGFIAAAGMGIIRRAMLSQTEGTAALVGLGQEDPESRSKDFGGRRLVRVDGGYLVLNFIKYRDRDYSAAERMRSLRERRRSGAGDRMVTQGGLCDSCEERFETPYSKYVVQDHHHSSGQMRGLICQSCNRIVGQIENHQTVVTSARSDLCSKYIKRYEQLRNERHVPQNDTQAECRVQSAEEDSGENPPTPLLDGVSAVAWGRWLQYRRDIKHPLKPASYEAAQKAMLKFGSDQEEVVEQSIANGYQGLFALKGAPAKAEGAKRASHLFMGKNETTGEPEVVKIYEDEMKPWELEKLRALERRFKKKTIFDLHEVRNRD